MQKTYHDATVVKSYNSGDPFSSGWTWTCRCGGYGRRFYTFADADNDATEHARIMSHCDNAEGK